MHRATSPSRRIGMTALSVLALSLAACSSDEGDEGGGTDPEASEPSVATAAASTTPTTGSSDTASPGTTSPDATSPDSTAGSDGTGGEAVGEDEEAYVEALVDNFQGTDDETARCIAESVVSGIGLEQLQNADVSPEALVGTSSLPELGIAIEDTAALEASIAGCGDGIVELTLGEAGATPEQQACADETLTDEIVAHVIVASLNGETPNEEAQAAATAFQECAGAA